MAASDKILFVDFEASSLETGSFPIEVGWCVQSGQGEAHLIRPATTWTAWSAASQTIHGISREQLDADGEPVEQVARRVAVAFAPERVLVLSDTPAYDQFWLNELLAQGGISVPIPLLDLWQALRRTAANILREAGVPDRAVPDLMRDLGEAAQHASEARGPARHRALVDAQRNAATWQDVLRRTDEVAALWRR